jgi:hypothetical protein
VSSTAAKLRALAVRATLVAASVLLAILVAEGAASLGTVLWHAAHRRPIAERSHTLYDPELGWVNRPGAVLPDLYRRGASVTIDHAGFRAAPGAAAADDRPRWACSGDSFTFGFGVDDRETWCALLADEHPGIATLNMGQGGYGLDQTYLWYRREAPRLHPSLHLLALDVHLFPRLARRDLTGYGKPVARLIGDRLVFENQPVPRGPFAHPWWTDLRQSLGELRLVGLAGSSPGAALENTDLAAVAGRLIEETALLDRRLGTRLVLLFLPVLGDQSGRISDFWREQAAGWARRLDLPLVDLVPALRQLTATDAQSLFILDGELPFTGAGGHPSVAGHRWLAREISARLATAETVTDRPR